FLRAIRAMGGCDDGTCAVKVLLLTQVMPFPPDSGPKAKTWNLVKWLGARHDLTLASFSRDETARGLDALRGYCRAVHAVPMGRGLVCGGQGVGGAAVDDRGRCSRRHASAGRSPRARDRLRRRTHRPAQHGAIRGAAAHLYRARRAQRAVVAVPAPGAHDAAGP